MPLTQVTDEYGTAEAFNARMLYRPSQGSNGRADWGAAHSARLVWFVQMMTDECPAEYDEIRTEENGEWTIECVDPETGNTAVREDVLTIAHIYQDTWDLTGLTVSEEHDLDVAIIYEDPEDDHDLQRDDQLLIASDNLNKGWLIGRDCDTQDGNGVCQGNGQRDVTVANMGSIVPTWFTSDSYIQVDTYLNYDHGAYFAYLVGTEVKPLLDTTFASYTDTIPTLMYAQDHTKRQINLDDMETGLVQASGNLLSFDLRPADVPTQTHSTLSWTPYQYVNGQWQAADIQSYLTRLDTLLQEEAYFQPENSTEAAEDEAYFKRSWVQMYYVSLWQSLSALTEMGNQPVHGRAADPDIPDVLYDPFFAPGTSAGATILAFAFFDFFKETTRLNPYTQLSFRSISPHTFGVGFTMAVAVTFVGLGLLILGTMEKNQQFVRAGEIILAVMTLVVGSVYAINALHMINTGAQGAATAATTVKNATSYQAIGVIGLGIILTAVWVMFLVQVTGKNMTELEFNVALSVALATTIVTLVLFAISLVGLGVLGIILGLVDAVFLLLNKKGPTQYVVEFIAQTLYDVNTTVSNLTSGDRLDLTVRDVAFVDLDQGFRETNSLDITMALTNTLKSSRAFWNRRDTVTRRNHFTYTLTTTPTEFTGPLPDWDDPSNDQWTPRINFRIWTTTTNDINVPLSSVGAGLNQGLEVYYNETFRTGYRACWYANIDCKWKYIRDTAHYPLFSTLVFDVFPTTIADFAQLNWGGDNLPFGEQADLDADGLLDVYGIDPSSDAFDTDGDGLNDRFEVENGYDPTTADGDFDGLNDKQELQRGTSPFKQDTDGDGVNDYVETVEGWLIVYNGNQLTRVWSDPTDPDRDDDGLDDLEEFIFGFNPWAATDPSRITQLVQFDGLGVAEEDAPSLYLRFEEAATSTAFADSSGAGNHATCTGDTCPSVSLNGRYAQSLQFDGTDDYIDTPSIIDPAAANFTIALWFKVDDYSNAPMLVQQLDGSGTGRPWLGVTSDGRLGSYIYASPPATGSDIITTGQWHHAAMIYDGEFVNFYLDGVLQNNDLPAASNDGGLRLGADKSNSANLDGALDDVVLFDRALTAVELDNLIHGRVNPNDNQLAADTSLRYQATVTNTSSTTATGFLVAENHYDTPEIPHPTAAFSFESEQRRAFFRNDTSEENRPYCLDALTCPTLGQAGRYGNGLRFDSDGDMLHLPTMDTNGDHTSYQVAFWLCVESLPSAGQRAMILDTASTEDGAVDIYLNSNGRLVWDIVGDPERPRVSDHTFSLNQWTHVAFVGHYQHFINGTSTTHPDAYWSGTAPPIIIGHGRVGNNLDGTEPFRGRIDELVYYGNGGTARINDVRNGNYSDDYQLLYRFDDAINYDGTTFYNSRNNAHTTCTGGTCPLLTIEGRGISGGRAIQFDGRDDYAYQPATNTYGTNNPRTFSLYVKPSEYPSTGNIAYLYDAAETNTNGDARAIFNLYMDENGHLSVDYGWGTHNYNTLDPLPLDQWSKIAVTFERNSGPLRYDMTLTLNDDSSSTVDICNNSVANCFHQVRLSAGNFGNNIAGTAAYNGLIDEVDFSATALNFDTPFVDFGYENLASEARTSTCLFRDACPSAGTGQFGDGLAFDGEDFLVVNTPINPAKTDFSASLWFKTSDFSDEPILLQQEDRNGAGRTWLGLRSDGRLYSFLGNSYLNSNTAAISGQWHHAAVTYDGTTLRLYLDGVLVASDVRTMEANNGAFWVGRPKLGVGNGFDRYFTGDLDELVIVPHALEIDAVQLLRDSSWPIIDVPDEFVPYSATALTNQTVSGTAVVNPYSATSQHRFEQEVEAALELQAQINYPIVDDNAANLEMFFPFEDGPGSTIFDNLISYPNGFITPDLEGVCLNANACPTAGLRGQVGRAAYFDGQDDYIFVDAFDYSTSGPNQVTAVSVWVNAAQGTILDIDRYRSGTNSTLEIDLNRILARDSVGTVRLIPYDAPRNEWFHLVLTIDGSDQATIYINGEPVATGELDVYFQNEVHSYSIGANIGGQDLLHGYLDDLRLYNTPLTQADVTTLYETSAPVMRFEFDEDDEATQFTDNSVNQFVGTPRLTTAVLNGITVTQPSPAPGTAGRIGNGALFDGQSYIEISDPGPLRDLTNDFTIMAWVRPDSVGTGIQRLLSPGLDDSINGYSFAIEDGRLLFHAHGVNKYHSIVNLEPDRWQHVAVVFNGNNNARFYLDGDLQQTMIGSSPANVNSDDPLYMGARVNRNGGFDQQYAGMLDELAVYERSLTTAELYGIYLRELRWYRDKQVTYLTVDTDAPTITLLSDAAYWPNQYTQLAVATIDPTTAVTLLDFGLKAPGETEFEWRGAPACANSGTNGATWCPFFDPTQLGGEGVYEFRFRAVDAVGNETISPVYTLYVDGTAPTAASSYAATPLNPTTQDDVNLEWTYDLSGTLSDGVISGTAVAGSGIITDEVMVQLVDNIGGGVSEVAQPATVTGNSWQVTYEMGGTRPHGTYAVVLTLEDEVGNGNTQTVGTVLLDERPPGVSIGTVLTQGQAITQTITLTGTAMEQPAWGSALVLHHFEEPAGATSFANASASLFYTPTNSTCTTCPTSGVAALFGDGLLFDGVDDIVSVPTPLNPVSDTFSAALWFNTSAVGSQQQLLQQLDENGTGRTWLTLLGDGRIQSFLGGTATQSVSSVTAGNWHHVALTHDGTTLRIYLNGQLEVTALRTLEATEGGFYLGADKGGGNLYAGLMDEFSLYDRALTPEEVYGLAQRYAVGVTAVEVAVEPFGTLEAESLNNLDSGLSWQSVTLDASGSATTGWQYSLPSGLEGFYEIYQRSTDAYGNIGQSEMVWRGLIDQVAPRITGTSGQQVWVDGQPRTAYSFTFTDFVLDETSYVQPCATGELNHLTYNDDTLLQDGLIYETSASCQVAGHETSRDLTACDSVGLCTTVTITPTTAVGSSILATATLQGRTDYVITHTVSLYAPGNPDTAVYSYTTTADTLGNFSLGGFPAGTYTVTVKADGYLQTVQSVVISGSNTAVDFGQLAAGDANGDNQVNILDLSILAGAYNTSDGDGSFNPRADFNGDGAVNILDLSLLAGNYNTVGEEP